MAEDCVAVLGPGLLGGSIAMALRERQLASRIHIWARRPAAAAMVTARGIADMADTDVTRVISDASLVILATPVPFMAQLARQIAAAPTRAGLLVTDVGSVKASVVREAGAVLRGANVAFIGSHPMAGSEQAGIGAAQPDLFDGAACIVTPEPDVDPKQLARLTALWAGLGCRVSHLDPLQHDEAIGRISHLPHLAACALTLAALQSDSSTAALAGQGFRDSTRIASGDAELWLGILRENRDALITPLRDLQAQLGRVLAILENLDEEQLLEFLREAKELRDGCLRPDNQSAASSSK